MRYFKCVQPKKKRYASDGSPINFIDLGNGWGVGATDRPQLAAELDRMIAEQRGGVFSIDQAEYDQLKKNRSSSPASAPWREEISRRGVEINHRPALETLSSIVPEAAAAETESKPAAPQVAMTEEPPRPKASKRK